MAAEDVAVYDEVAFQHMDYDDEARMYTHACPCGDMFVISADELRLGETIAHCNDCSLVIRVVLDADARKTLGMDDTAGVEGVQAGGEPVLVA